MGSRVLKGAVVVAAFVMVQAVAPAIGLAGGVIKYKVKVKNDTPDATCRVDLFCGDIRSNCKKTCTIAPGADCTLTVDGPQCTRFLAGSCDHRGLVSDLYRRCISGGAEDTQDCLAACWSSDWVVREHPETPQQPFHFDKR